MLLEQEMVIYAYSEDPHNYLIFGKSIAWRHFKHKHTYIAMDDKNV